MSCSRLRFRLLDKEVVAPAFNPIFFRTRSIWTVRSLLQIMEPEAIDESYVFGIDLSTTNTCAAVATGKRLSVFCNLSGKYTLPSLVTFTSECVYVGYAAV